MLLFFNLFIQNIRKIVCKFYATSEPLSRSKGESPNVIVRLALCIYYQQDLSLTKVAINNFAKRYFNYLNSGKEKLAFAISSSENLLACFAKSAT